MIKGDGMDENNGDNWLPVHQGDTYTEREREIERETQRKREREREREKEKEKEKEKERERERDLRYHVESARKDEEIAAF